MALVPTLLALAVGVGLGLLWGGRISNVVEWMPPLWEALVGGIAVKVLLDLLPWSGFVPSTLSIASTAALLLFAVVNVRVGGMVLVVAGLGLNLLVSVVNWGMPVSASALVSAGIVAEQQVSDVVLSGGREVADGAVLGFLGGVIPLPWGQVVSIGDVLVLIGIALVTANVLRRYEVGQPTRSGGRGGRGSTGEYRSALEALGRGPAPRKGPGLHPSRLGSNEGGRRRR